MPKERDKTKINRDFKKKINTKKSELSLIGRLNYSVWRKNSFNDYYSSLS